MVKIGENIMRRRKELGLTQVELANRMGYKSRSTINKIELGVNDIPQSKIVAFANALQTTPAYIMGWEEEQKNNDIITDIILKLRSDNDFLSVVESLSQLDNEKLAGVKQMLNAFQK